MLAFSEQFLDELAARSDIVDVVGSYVTLTKRSGANQFGLCPFHSEKTPSFSVNSDKQIYHCFGCGKGGGVFNFIMEVENLEFPDAVRFLAKRAGMEVPEEGNADARRQRRRILELNREAARFFHENLKKPEGRAVLDYINSRGIRPMAKRFGLGAAPDSWDALISAMSKLGYEKYDLISAGLAVKSSKGTGIYDRFRNRLVFPVIDVRGDVLGFGSRIINPDDSPKYLNSPETSVYNKSRVLFGLNLAKNTKRPNLILCEGNIDVITLHQAGFDNAIAGMGTALTAEQARLISRYTSDVILCYDSDEAGQKAAQRSIELLSKTALNVRVLRIPGAKDPDEFIREHGPAAFENLLNMSENHIEYRLLGIQSRYDLSLDDQRIEYLKAAAELIASLDSPVEREIYAARVAEQTGVRTEAVTQEADRLRRRQASSRRKKQEREQLAITNSAQPRDRSLSYDDISSALAEKGVIHLLLLDPSIPASHELPPAEDFSSPFLRRTYELLLERIAQGASVNLNSLSGEFSQAEMSELVDLMQQPQSLANTAQSLADYSRIIATQKLARADSADRLASLVRAKREGAGS